MFKVEPCVDFAIDELGIKLFSCVTVALFVTDAVDVSLDESFVDGTCCAWATCVTTDEDVTLVISPCGNT